jgi:hypothetical protein
MRLTRALACVLSTGLATVLLLAAAAGRAGRGRPGERRFLWQRVVR